MGCSLGCRWGVVGVLLGCCWGGGVVGWWACRVVGGSGSGHGGTWKVGLGWGPEELGPRRVGGTEGWGARRVEGPIFRAFFSLSRQKFHSFFSLWGSSRGILVVGAQMCAIGVLGLSCEAPAAPKPQWSVATTRGHTRKTPRERETKKKIRREGKKRAKCWAVGGRGGPGEHPNLGPTHRHTHTILAKTLRILILAKCGLANCGQNFETLILAKCGLATCGHENDLAKFGFFFWPNAVSNAVWPNAGMTL